jgi:hypothetical protein
MSRIFVLAVVLAVAAVSVTIPFLWQLSQSYLTVGSGLHPFLCGGLAVGLAAIALQLVGMLLNHPAR